MTRLSRNSGSPGAVTIVQGTTAALLQPLATDQVDGWNFRAQIRPGPGSPILYFEWTPGMIEARPWALVLPLDPEITTTWTWAEGWLGIEAVSPEGDVRRIIHAPVKLDREIVYEQAGAPSGR